MPNALLQMPQVSPHYSLAPDIGYLQPEQLSLLETMAGYFARREENFTVVRALTTDDHHVFELKTSLGTVLMLERRTV